VLGVGSGRVIKGEGTVGFVGEVCESMRMISVLRVFSFRTPIRNGRNNHFDAASRKRKRYPDIKSHKS
jgi:hypothetical protein